MSQANATAQKGAHPKQDNKHRMSQSKLKEFRTPPHNLALEQAVLAALMTVANPLKQVGDVLTENDFYATRHKYVFGAIAQLSKDSSPYDAVLVHDWLTIQNLLDAVGGEEYLMQLMADSPLSSLMKLMLYYILKNFQLCVA